MLDQSSPALQNIASKVQLPAARALPVLPNGGVPKALSQNPGSKVAKLEQQINRWLGKDARLIKNKAGDTIILSQDGMRKVRFDFNRPFPHENPHMHLEILRGEKWKDFGQIYPFDVPHR